MQFLWYCDIRGDNMNTKMLEFQNNVDIDTECLCRHVKSDTERFIEHYHNFYELFLVLKGNVVHTVNGKEQRLCAGQLLFIRDFDVHNYRSADGSYFEFINLTFTKNTLNSMLEYLGEGFPSSRLFDAQMPPMCNLTERECEKLFYAFADINISEGKAMLKLKARTLILNIFTRYFFNYSEEETNIPLWLEMTWEKMKTPKNFIAGVERMYEISGKSREHLCRSMKKYYGITPSALIVDLRLDYFVKHLLASNLSVTDLCYECGFENISWFYKVFLKKYGMTPIDYRKQYQ